MDVLFSKTFTKAYKKLDHKIQVAFGERLSLFIEDEYNPVLKNHTLKGAYAGTRSISITGDFRAHYVVTSGDVRSFVAIGTHSELYKK